MIDWVEVKPSRVDDFPTHVVRVTDDNVAELRKVFGPDLYSGLIILRKGFKCRAVYEEQAKSLGISIEADPLCPKEWWGLGYRPLSHDEMPPFGTVVHLRGRNQVGKPIEGLGLMRHTTVKILTGQYANNYMLPGENAFYVMEVIPPASWEKEKEEK